MSEPTSPDDRSVGPPERLHPFFLLTGLSGSLRGVGGAYAALAYLFVTGRFGTALAVASAMLVLMMVAVFIYWRRFEFRVGENEIRIDSGILSRTHRSIPFDRIQDVDITQGPVARLLGLARVRFETGASAGEEEGVLRAIGLERAGQLRDLVRARRSQPAAPAGEAAEAPAEAEPEPVYVMSPKRLLLAGTFNFSLALLAGLFGLAQTFGDALGFNPFSRSFWRSVLSAGGPIRDYILAHQVATAIVGLCVTTVARRSCGRCRAICSVVVPPSSITT